MENNIPTHTPTVIRRKAGEDPEEVARQEHLRLIGDAALRAAGRGSDTSTVFFPARGGSKRRGARLVRIGL